MKIQQQVHLEYSDNSYNHFVQLELSFLGFIMRISLSQKVGYSAMEQSSPEESSRTRQLQILVETLSLVEFKKARTSLSSKGSPKKERAMALRKMAMTFSRNF